MATVRGRWRYRYVCESELIYSEIPGVRLAADLVAVMMSLHPLLHGSIKDSKLMWCQKNWERMQVHLSWGLMLPQRPWRRVAASLSAHEDVSTRLVLLLLPMLSLQPLLLQDQLQVSSL